MCMVDLSSVFVLVFFFKQKTAYELRISDWSSDVCSSDLGDIFGGRHNNHCPAARRRRRLAGECGTGLRTRSGPEGGIPRLLQLRGLIGTYWNVGVRPLAGSSSAPCAGLRSSLCARTVTTACAPAVDQRICCSLFMRRFTKALAKPSDVDVPTGCPARWPRASLPRSAVWPVLYSLAVPTRARMRRARPPV